MEWREMFEELLSFQYHYEEEIAMKTKVSVSELKHRAMERMMDEDTEPWEAYKEEEEEERYVPSFMAGVQKENIGAKRGTAMHRVLECYDFTRAPETLKEQLGEIEEQKKMDREQMNLVSVSSLQKFLETDLGRRMRKAAQNGKLYREKPFVMGKPAKEVLEENSREEMVLIQGIIDVFFEEEGEIVLLDYKTDYVKHPKELVSRYGAQLELYREAVERAFEKRVKECLLYSFCLGETINTADN